MRYKKDKKKKKTSPNTDSVVRPQYCTVNASVAVQHIRQTNHVKEGAKRLAYTQRKGFLKCGEATKERHKGLKTYALLRAHEVNHSSLSRSRTHFKFPYIFTNYRCPNTLHFPFLHL